MANSITVTIPLTVTVSIGQPEIEIVAPESIGPIIDLRELERLEETRFEETKRNFQKQLNNRLGEITDKICDR